VNVSHAPDERPSEAELPRFESLPVLSVLTACPDGERHVIEDCNERFVDRLDRSRSKVVGRPLVAFYDSAGVPDGSVPSGDDRRGAQFDGGDSVSGERSTPGSGLGAVSTATQTHGRASECPERNLIAADGHLVHTLAEVVPRTTADGYKVFHVDTTRLKRREKQVSVLNRLLRHNVRNDLNLLRGYAQTLRDHDDEEVVAAGTVIDRIADRWLGLAEKGREIEQLSTAASRRTVALQDLLTSAQTTVEQDRPEGVIDVNFDGVDPELPVSEQWYPAIVELCENGIKHATPRTDDGDTTAADVDGPGSMATPASVTITVTPGSHSGWLVIAVADDGPGIPPDERITLQGDTETPLRHGSGLGTWLVRFVVEQFGGRISVEEHETGGSVVELHLPLPDEDDSDR
jgi:signal transduction histidine kinase